MRTLVNREFGRANFKCDPITLGAAGIMAGSAIAGNVANQIAVGKANKKGIELAREQMRWQEEMWNKTNAYNSYSNQIKLMQEAGLNPQFMFSNGGPDATAGNAGTYQNPSIMAADYAAGMNLLGQAGSALLQGKQLEINEGQLDNDRQRVALEKALNEANIDEIASRIGVNTETAKKYVAEAAVAWQQVDNLKSEYNVNVETLKQMELQTDYIVPRLETELANSIQQLNVSKATEQKIFREIANMIKEGTLLDLNAGLTSIGLLIERETSGSTINSRKIEAGQKGLDYQINSQTSGATIQEREGHANAAEDENARGWTSAIGQIFNGSVGVAGTLWYRGHMLSMLKGSGKRPYAGFVDLDKGINTLNKMANGGKMKAFTQEVKIFTNTYGKSALKFLIKNGTVLGLGAAAIEELTRMEGKMDKKNPAPYQSSKPYPSPSSGGWNPNASWDNPNIY